MRSLTWLEASDEEKEEIRLGLEIAKDLDSFESGDRITVEFDGGSFTGEVGHFDYDMETVYQNHYDLLEDQLYEVFIVVRLPDSERAKIPEYADDLDADTTELHVYGNVDYPTHCLLSQYVDEDENKRTDTWDGQDYSWDSDGAEFK